MTTYKIVYQLSNRVKVIHIEAASPMIAFKKFKAMMPEIVYKNLALKEIDEIKEPEELTVKNNCFPCSFKNLKSAI